MTYLIAYHQMLNYLLTTDLYFRLCLKSMHLQVNSTVTYSVANKLKIYFSVEKQKKRTHPTLVSNNGNTQANTQKHLGFTLNFKLMFNEHLDNAMNKINKIIDLLRNFLNSLARKALITNC